MLRIAVSFVLLVFAAFPALAQEADDLLGGWRIISVDERDSDYSGEILITATDEPGVYKGELIMQDSCCGGNFARVKQSSMIRVINGQIFVWSKIEAFLEQKDVTPGTRYVADNFRMNWESETSLIGVSAGGFAVRWIRTEAGMV